MGLKKTITKNFSTSYFFLIFNAYLAKLFSVRKTKHTIQTKTIGNKI